MRAAHDVARRLDALWSERLRSAVRAVGSHAVCAMRQWCCARRRSPYSQPPHPVLKMKRGSPHWQRPYERLHVVPVTLRDARAYVNAHHRHLRAPAGAKLAIGVRDDRERLRGVAILGRPVARRLDNGSIIEVTRVATDGCKNACSALYSGAVRIARALGYRQIITYTLAREPGTSLRAAGWMPVRSTRGGSWSRRNRPRRRSATEGSKQRWSTELRVDHHLHAA